MDSNEFEEFHKIGSTADKIGQELLEVHKLSLNGIRQVIKLLEVKFEDVEEDEPDNQPSIPVDALANEQH